MVTKTKPDLMTGEEICMKYEWSDEMVRSLLPAPDAPAAKRGRYRCDRYSRERVIALAETSEVQAAKKRWHETLRGAKPYPGWTTRLGDIGRLLGVSAVAVGKILELLGYRYKGKVTDLAIANGCGVHRWDGFILFADWHADRVASAIRVATEDPGWYTVADALDAALTRQDVRTKLTERNRSREEREASAEQEQKTTISAWLLELQELRAAEPDMDLMDALEYLTPDPAAQLLLYKHYCPANRCIGSFSAAQSDSDLSSAVEFNSRDLARLERRARREGFEV